ncbi:APC family permease [Amycolatopsis australiensis]|uniref:APC family permease n=1 Tax=Amycolatopsis australiensis TaxID=546364 RepID=UPI001FE9F1CD|nr:APC family permease [Amycolatopsis australiensis]
MLAYNAATIGIFGALADFGAQVMTGLLGTPVPWQLVALVTCLAVAVLAYFEVTLSAKVLGVALAAEVLVLLAFDVAVLLKHGFRGFSLEVYPPSVVFGGGFGVSLMLAFGSFVGFEATALYGEEARDPHRAVPRATYLALAIIAGFYLVTTWAAISAYGVDQARMAAAADPQDFVFNAGADYLGKGYADVMGILVVTSLFAAFLAFHCNTARYEVALARDGLLPRRLAGLHPKHGSPVAASATQLILLAVTTIGFTLAGQDPYRGMSASLYGLGVLGIVLLQAIAAASTVGYFLRHRGGEPVWGALLAPALGGVGLIAGLALMLANYPTVTGSSLVWVNSLPWTLPAAALIGGTCPCPTWLTGDVTTSPAPRRATRTPCDRARRGLRLSREHSRETHRSSERHDILITANLTGSPHLRARGGGCLIQVPSMAGRTVLPGLSPYHVAKWASRASSRRSGPRSSRLASTRYPWTRAWCAPCFRPPSAVPVGLRRTAARTAGPAVLPHGSSRCLVNRLPSAAARGVSSLSFASSRTQGEGHGVAVCVQNHVGYAGSEVASPKRRHRVRSGQGSAVVEREGVPGELRRGRVLAGPAAPQRRYAEQRELGQLEGQGNRGRDIRPLGTPRDTPR